jgi:hypothetical protein
LKNLRLVHFYLGVFFAPMVIFFAFTGVLQVFKMHEAYRDTPGAPGDWIAWMAQVHKEQALIPPKPAPARKADAPAPPAAPKEPLRGTAMKWFTMLMGASLIATTLLGLYIAFNYPRRRASFVVAFVLGLVMPIALLQL